MVDADIVLRAYTARHRWIASFLKLYRSLSIAAHPIELDGLTAGRRGCVPVFEQRRLVARFGLTIEQYFVALAGNGRPSSTTARSSAASISARDLFSITRLYFRAFRSRAPRLRNGSLRLGSDEGLDNATATLLIEEFGRRAEKWAQAVFAHTQGEVRWPEPQKYILAGAIRAISDLATTSEKSVFGRLLYELGKKKYDELRAVQPPARLG